ncbi:hypothetical protein ACP70R_042053 [Stipagrostis hirtigluma subsp. patula]
MTNSTRARASESMPCGLPARDAVTCIVEEDAAALRFVAATVDGFLPSGAHAYAVEIHPGVTKIVVRDVSGGGGEDDDGATFELDRPVALPPPALHAPRHGHLDLRQGRARHHRPQGRRPRRRRRRR